MGPTTTNVTTGTVAMATTTTTTAATTTAAIPATAAEATTANWSPLPRRLVARLTSTEAAPPRGRFAHGWSGQDPTMQGRRRILLVEDEPSITEPLAEALGREGFDTQVAGTVAESLDLAAEIQPDLVLLDVMLPD